METNYEGTQERLVKKLRAMASEQLDRGVTERTQGGTAKRRARADGISRAADVVEKTELTQAEPDADDLVLIDADDPVSIRRGMKRLSRVVFPWHHDESVPPSHVRVTATGCQVGTVDPGLGGYADRNDPEMHGWGYRAQHQNALDNGIEDTDQEARDAVDQFLVDHGYELIGDSETVESRTQ